MTHDINEPPGFETDIKPLFRESDRHSMRMHFDLWSHDDVVVSIPPRAYTAVPVEPLAGKSVLDTINYIPQRDGPIPGLYDGPLSSSEVLQRHLGAAHVVKVFNNITCWRLRRVSHHQSPTEAALAGSSHRPDRARHGTPNTRAPGRGMYYPTRWDPYFKPYMTLADIYHYPTQHFDHHDRQLSAPQ